MGQSRSISVILNERLEVTQAIAAANVEHLRLSQIASGMMVLDMKDREDGVETDARLRQRAENEAARDRCMDEISALEAQLARLDRELEATAREDD